LIACESCGINFEEQDRTLEKVLENLLRDPGVKFIKKVSEGVY
jgi:hypothetical protein